MSRLAVIASIVLAGSVAFADPPDRAPNPAEVAPHGERFFQLGEGHASMSNRQMINVRDQFGRLSMLRLEVIHGEPYIRRVIVRFADGTSDTIPVDRRLSESGDRKVDLPLHGERRVERIIVQSEPNTHATYVVKGER
ncbi:MAG TPA: hypothetical protein VLX92_33025 [Kofleriaceae bacterium]|nr:hypothetical protein [Kofleriaceae bacterium]